MQQTKIEWVVNKDGSRGYTINPIKGICRMGCPYCYARAIYTRFKWNPEVRLDMSVFAKISTLQKGSTIFICSTHEIFGDWIPNKWIYEIFHAVSELREHTFITLTKNPQRVIGQSFPPNVWVGVTAETTEKAISRVEALNKSHAGLHFISIEPMQEEVDLTPIISKLDWVIVGQETGNRKERIVPKEKWIQSLYDKCKIARIPIFIKNNLTNWRGEKLQQTPYGSMSTNTKEV